MTELERKLLEAGDALADALKDGVKWLQLPTEHRKAIAAWRAIAREVKESSDEQQS